MTLNDLSKILNEMYNGARSGDTVVMIHLFGIKYAAEIVALDIGATAIAKAAHLSDNYGTEIQKGVRLAAYVTIKPDAFV